MRTLVTGASGFIGGHLVQQLRAAGHAVRALVRSSDRARALAGLGVETALGDVTYLPSLRAAVQNVDTVFHLASRVTDWGKWSEFEAATVGGTVNMLRAASEVGARRFIHMSSVAVYEDQHTRRHRVVTEDAPHGGAGDRTHGHYARAKVLAEETVWAFHNRGLVRATVVRPALVYGPGDTTTLPRLIEYLRSATASWIGRENPVVDPIYVADVARCMLAAASTRAIGEAYNVAPEQQIGVRDFWTALCQTVEIPAPSWTIPRACVAGWAAVVEGCSRMTGRRQPPTVTKAGIALFTEDRHHDPAKAVGELGWRPMVGLAEGLGMTADWLRQSQSRHQRAMLPVRIPAPAG